tara:strand:- start:2166 stop:2405 length:240 start_codon:yes stop_codon:yes gene_type:complete
MPRKKITAKEFVEQATGVRLSAHEKLCAERMNRLIKNIDELRKDVSDLKDNVSRGKGVVAVLVFIGTVVASIIGYFNLK